MVLKEVSAEESKHKICKIIGKKILAKGKVQLNLHDGKNILCNKEAKVGDSIMVSLPKLEVKEILPLKAGAYVYLIDGKHQGGHGKLKEIKGSQAIYVSDKKEIETAKEYLLVITDKHLTVKNN